MTRSPLRNHQHSPTAEPSLDEPLNTSQQSFVLSSSPLIKGLQNESIWAKKKESTFMPNQEVTSPKQSGPLTSVGHERGTSLSNSFVQIPPKVLSPLNKNSETSKLPTETDYAYHQEHQQQRLSSKPRQQQPFMIKPVDQSGSLESFNKEDLINSNFTMQLNQTKQKKSQSQARSTIVTGLQQDNKDAADAQQQNDLGLTHTSKTPKSNKNMKGIYLNNQGVTGAMTATGAMTGPVNLRNWNNEGLVPPEITRFDSQFDKMNRMNSRLRGKNGQQQESISGAPRNDSANPTVFFKNRKSNYDLQSKLIPMHNSNEDSSSIRQSPWQQMNSGSGIPNEGYEPVPYSHGKIYQMKTSFRNYQQPKILNNDGKYQMEETRSQKAQSQIQQQQKTYQHKDNTYSTSALKREIPQKLDNTVNQKSQVLQKTSMGNLKQNLDNQNHMKFIQNYQDSQQQQNNNDNFYDYQNMFESSNLSNLITSSTNGQVSKVKIHLQKLPKAQRLPGVVDPNENQDKTVNNHDKFHNDRMNRQFIPNHNPQIGIGINAGGSKNTSQQQQIVQQQLQYHQQLQNINQKRKSKNFFKLDQNMPGSEFSNQQNQIMSQLYTNTYTHGVQNQSPSLQQNKKLVSTNVSEKMNSKTHSETMQAILQQSENQYRQQEMAITAKKKNTFSIHKQNGVSAKQQFREFNNQKKSLSYTNGAPSIPQVLEQETSHTEGTARDNGPPNLSKLLLTPWSERQPAEINSLKEEQMANKEVNRITQISQMSQNGLKLQNSLQKKPQQNIGHLENVMKSQNSNRQIIDDNQYKKQQNTIHNMILNIISGSSGDQIQKNLSNSKSLLSKNIAHMGLLSGLNEHQLRLLILNYYQNGMQKEPVNQQLLQTTLAKNRQQSVTQPSEVIPELNATDQGSMKTKENSSLNNLNSNNELKVIESSNDLKHDGQQQNHFYMSLNYQGGQMMANIDAMQSSLDKKGEKSPPYNIESAPTPKLGVQKANNGVGGDRKILSNRQKLMNKVNKNINIIGEEGPIEQSQSPYDGMFNIGIKKIQNKKVSKNLFGENSSPAGSIGSGKGISQSLIQKEHQEYVNGIMNQKKYLQQLPEFPDMIKKEEAESIDKQNEITKQMINTQYSSTSQSKFVNQLKSGSGSMPTSQSNMKQVSSLQPTGSISNPQVPVIIADYPSHQLGASSGFNLTTKANTNVMATVNIATSPENQQKPQSQHSAQQNAQLFQSANLNYASTQPNTKQSPRSQSNQQQFQHTTTSREKNDFNLEYAQLIAKQFPIHDDNSQLIDYSNINEFQLELLALHEEYGEENDPAVKKKIFLKLASMNQDEYFRCKRLGIPYMKNYPDSSLVDKKINKNGIPLRQNGRPFGNHVGKDGGNPEYKKNVIQLEKERLEREKQELIMKRKRNSNYIQQCIRHGNEHYSGDRLNSLAWLKKDKPVDDEADHHHSIIANKLDEKNLEILRKKQEVLATYNKMSKQNKPSFADDGMYRYSMIKGNNSALVEKVLKTRDHWIELEEKHLTLYSFKWAPTSKFINYDQLGAHGQKKLVNHIQGHDQLTTKDLLYKNMHKYLEANKVNVFQYLPIQFVLDLSAKNFIQEVDKFCKYYNCIEKVKIKSGINNSENNREDNENQIKEINQNIQTSKVSQNESKYKNQVTRKYVIDDQMYNGGNVWLIKPNDFNRGRGVKLFNTLEQLRNLMKEFSLGNEMDFYMHNACCQILANEKQVGTVQKPQQEEPQQQQEILSPTGKGKELGAAKEAPNLSANVKSEVFVIQKYIERPLLIDERKFDIRLWVLVNTVDLQDQKCYLFKEGYIRTSSHKFTLSQESIDQPFVHLTNNAVQQYDENYGKLEEGNQLSFQKATDILKQQTGQDIDFYEILNKDIVPIIELSFKSVEGKLNPNAKKHSFEIYGYDFMIDELLRPWLIEVNTNPCLEETSAILKQFLPRMIDDAFKLTLDKLYPPARENMGAVQQSTKQSSSEGDERLVTESPLITEQTSRLSGKKQNYAVTGHSDSDNMWQHIYTLKPQ